MKHEKTKAESKITFMLNTKTIPANPDNRKASHISICDAAGA